MQIVIDIDEHIYKQIMADSEVYILDNEVDRILIENAIYNGTPLPKGHGRLIDYGYVVDAIDDWINAEEYKYTNATDYLRNRIKDTPTIIEESDSGE